MNQSNSSLMALELSQTLETWNLYRYRVEIDGAVDGEDATIITRKAANALSYANWGNAIISFGYFELVSVEPIRVVEAEYKGLKYKVTDSTELTLQAIRPTDREAMERLLRSLLRLGGDQLCRGSNGTLVSPKSSNKDVKIADASPSQRVPIPPGGYLQAYQTVTLNPEVLPCGTVLVSVHLKHELIPEPHINLDWVAHNKQHWLGFIKKARHTYKGKNGQFSTLTLHDLAADESSQSKFSTPKGEISLLQYHLEEGNIDAESAQSAQSSRVFQVSYGNSKNKLLHLGLLLQPMFDFDTLSAIDPDLLTQVAKNLKWPVQDRARAAFGKIKGLQIPVLNAHLKPISDKGRYQRRIPLNLKLQFANGKTGKDERDMLKHGAYKSMRRTLVAGMAMGGEPDAMEKHFNTIEDRCRRWGVEDGVKWSMVPPAADHHELAHRLSQKELEPSLLVIGIGSDVDKAKIRDVAYRHGHATQFMRLDYPANKYNDYYYNNLAAGVFSKGGGVLCGLVNMPGNADLFIGLDMGGVSQRVPGSAFLFNREGAQLGWQLAEAQAGERLHDEALYTLLERSIVQFQQSQNGQRPQGIVLHRDGRFFESIEIIERLQNEFKVPIDVLEVIKSGAPALMTQTPGPEGKKRFINPQLGDAFELVGLDELILATYSGKELGTWGDQVTVRPLRLRKRFGNTSLTTLAQQVLALSRIHGASLYRHPRLPVTTHHADRFATLRQECQLDDLARMDRLCPIYL